MARSEDITAALRVSRIAAGHGPGTASGHLGAPAVWNRGADRRVLALCGARLRARVSGRARHVVSGSKAQVGRRLGTDGPGAEGRSRRTRLDHETTVVER